ncbi:MAG: type II toxin-antitoxin system VapC family toxin [Bauldia sp.]
MFLLDTNVISEIQRKARADGNVTIWAGSVAVEQMFISAITVMEVLIGAEQIGRRDAVRAEALRAWIEDQVLLRFAGRILPFDTATAQRCALLHVPNPRPERDAMIAATAAVHGLTVVTRNTRDFESAGVKVFNPWLAPPPM